MELKLQPEGSKTCGQHCIAMIAGISVKEAIEVVGVSTKSGTSAKHMSSALTKLGYKPRKGLNWFIYKKELPKVCLLVIKWNTKGSHWVVYNDGKVYCPVHGIFDYSYQNIANLKGVAGWYLKIGERI